MHQLPVQEPGQQPGQVGVAAPYGREGLHRGREARDDATVFHGQVRVALARGDARPRSAQLHQAGEAADEVALLYEIEADDALGLVLVWTNQRRVRLHHGPQDRGRRVHDRVETALARALHEAHEEALVQVRRQAPGEDHGRRVLHQVLQAPGELPDLRGVDLGSVLVDLRLGPRHRVYDGGRRARVTLYLYEVERYRSGGQPVPDRVAVAPAGK